MCASRSWHSPAPSPGAAPTAPSRSRPGTADGIGEVRFRIDDFEGEPVTDYVEELTFHSDIDEPGDYRLFAQVRVDGFLHTLPVELTVARSTSPS